MNILTLRYDNKEMYHEYTSYDEMSARNIQRCYEVCSVRRTVGTCT